MKIDCINECFIIGVVIASLKFDDEWNPKKNSLLHIFEALSLTFPPDHLC